MKDRYDDDRYYDERQDFGPLAIRNYREVVLQYTYASYVERFRGRADRHGLVSGQRPKLEEAEFTSLKKQLLDAMRHGGEGALLAEEKNGPIVSRLLLSDLLEEECL